MIDTINQWLAGMGFAPLVGVAVIALVTVVSARMVQFVGDKIALALSRWSRLGIRTQLFDIIRHPLWISIALLGFLAEVEWLKPPPPADFFLTGAAKSALTIIWIIALGKTVGLVCDRLEGYYPGAEELLRLIENVGIAAVAVMGGLAVLTVWQINLTPLVASAGLAGVIVALAAKDILGNFFGGISVFLDRPFRRGDYIVLNTGERGKVVDIGLRSTRILTRDDVLISVPNSIIVNTKIINESAPYRRMRVRIKVSVQMDAAIHQVEEILLNVARENSLVLSEPEPRVRFRSFGDSAMDFELLCWTAQPGDKGRLIHELSTAAVREFRGAGINFPTPQRDVFVHTVSGGAITGVVKRGHAEDSPRPAQERSPSASDSRESSAVHYQ